jgi:hypothetical protein
MMPRMRGPLVGLLVTAAVAGGCDTSPKTLSCGQSIADACASSGDCVLSWDQAAGGSALCSAMDPAPRRADCGAYHVVTIVRHLDAVTSYYYDVATGMLVAIVGAYAPAATTTCTAGPSGGFQLPTCAGPASGPLSQCLDGGPDAAASD